MNKRLIAIALAGLMSFTSVFGGVSITNVYAATIEQHIVHSDNQHTEYMEVEATGVILAVLKATFLKYTVTAFSNKISPMVSTAALRIAVNNKSTIMNAVRRAPDHASLFDWVRRELVNVGVSNADATSIAHAVSQAIRWW